MHSNGSNISGMNIEQDWPTAFRLWFPKCIFWSVPVLRIFYSVPSSFHYQFSILLHQLCHTITELELCDTSTVLKEKNVGHLTLTNLLFASRRFNLLTSLDFWGQLRSVPKKSLQILSIINGNLVNNIRGRNDEFLEREKTQHSFGRSDRPYISDRINHPNNFRILTWTTFGMGTLCPTGPRSNWLTC